MIISGNSIKVNLYCFFSTLFLEKYLKIANSNDIILGILLMSEFDNQSSSMGRFLGGPATI